MNRYQIETNIRAFVNVRSNCVVFHSSNNSWDRYCPLSNIVCNQFCFQFIYVYHIIEQAISNEVQSLSFCVAFFSLSLSVSLSGERALCTLHSFISFQPINWIESCFNAWLNHVKPIQLQNTIQNILKSE